MRRLSAVSKRDGMLFLFFKSGVGIVVAAGDTVTNILTGAVVVVITAGVVPIVVAGISEVKERPRTETKITVFSRIKLLRFA